MDSGSIFDKIPATIRGHMLPIFFASFGLILFAYGLIYLYVQKPQIEDKGIVFEKRTQSKSEAKTDTIVVNVAGAVNKPGVYELTSQARVKDALLKAGGLSKEADSEWVEKKLNLAAKMTDGSKLYVPALGEEEGGNAVLGVSSAGSLASDGNQQTGQSGSININTASQSELESLPGIGPVTAGKIIASRPYTSLEDLVAKKAVGAKTLEKFREQVSY